MTFVQQFLITTAALVISELFVHQASGLAGKGDGPTDKDRLFDFFQPDAKIV